MPRAHPPISVVIPTFNARQLLAKHLPDVVLVLRSGDEIVVADDASTDDTANWVTSYAPVLAAKGIALRLARHTTNQRFAAAVNTGVTAAKHPFIFLLNNDVSPLTEDILALLWEWFDDPAMFAVGCAEVTEDKPGAKVSGRGTGNFERGLLAHWYDPDQTLHQTLWTAGGSMFFDRAKFLEIGGLDTLYYPAYEEDRDLSYRAIKHGWKIAFEPDALVLHQHETTNLNIFGRRRVQVISWKNQFLLVWKNITDPLLLLQHLVWLPYHLSITAWRTRGALLQGFLMALRQLPQAMDSRRSAAALWTRSDREVLGEYGSHRPSMAR